MRKCKTIAILNYKGGVGKTTTAINLSAALQRMGKKVLLVDTDFQCNSTRTLGFEPSPENETLYDLLAGKTFNLPVYDFRDGYDYIPSDPKMEFIADILSTKMCREEYLRRNLSVCLDDYDYIIIDCPSNGGLLNTNAMVAATHIIIPVECEPYSLHGLQRIQNQTDEVREMLNQNLDVIGYLRTKYDHNKAEHRNIGANLAREFPRMTIPTIIRNCAYFTKINRDHPTIYQCNAACHGAHDYAELAEWVDKRCNIVKA